MLGFLTLFLVAISLSMDTFSLSIIYGTLGLKKKKIYILSIIVGLFHFFMPLLGNYIGSPLIDKLPIAADVVVGIIFLIIAIQMLFQKEEILDLTKFSALLLFGFTVSIDSFSVGIGLSTITDNYWLAYFTFSIISLIFTFVGLCFGQKLNNKFSNKATFLGAILLIVLSFSYVF